MSSSSPPPQSAGAAMVLILTLGGLVAAAAEPSLRMLTGPLLFVLLLVTILLATQAQLGQTQRGRSPAAPPASPEPVAQKPTLATPPNAWAALSPREFELEVARLLTRLPGWQAEATRGHADQGADVLACGPGGVRIAIQVKRYRSAVGNGAVQAIVASKAVYNCQHALVITCGPGYTRAAKELAQANGVRLWTARELAILHQQAELGAALPTGMLP